MKNKEKFIEQCIKNVDKICDFWDMVCECKLTCDNHCDECRKVFAKWLEEEYNPKPRLSHDEYVILKNVDKDYKWITRDCEEYLFLDSSAHEPSKEMYSWNSGGFGTKAYFSFDHLFKFIKWENEEPTSIKELLDEYESYVISNLSLKKK